MAKATPIKVSFNAGELSAYLDGRTDQGKYFNGCSLLENFLPLIEGPITRRGGTYFAQEVKASSQYTWLVPFRFNVNQSFVLEFGNQYIRFFTSRGVVTEAAKTITAATKANPCVITSNAHGYSNGDYIYILGIAGMTELNGGYFKVAGVTANTFQLQDQDGNNIDSSSYTTYTSGGTASRVYQVTTPYTAADLTDATTGDFRLKFKQVGDVVYLVHPSYQQRKLSRFGNTNWTLTTLDTTNGPFKDRNTDSTITVYASAETGTGITLTASSAIFQAGHVGSLFYMEQKLTDIVQQWEVGKAMAISDRRRSGNNNYIAQNAATTGNVKPTHTKGAAYDGSGGVQWLYADSGFGIVRITAIGGGGTTATADVITRLPSGCVGVGNPTYRWAHSLFSTVEGWPEYVGLTRERLTFLKGIELALSVAGDYENFASKIGGEITADAAIRITLPTENAPRWMVDGSQDLIIGTGGDEIAVGKITTTDPLGPDNIEAKVKTSYGSSNVDPVLVGDEILFASRSGKRLRSYQYSFQINGYQGSDLTILSRHVTGDGLIQLAYAQEPHSIIWAVTYDGYLVGFTFNREQDVLAWHRHPIGGDGIVESVCTIPSPDGSRDDAWLIVRRTINGVTRRYVEYITPEFEGDDSTIADAFYVDSGLTYSGSATTTISGLKHLLGKSVDILADGGAHPQKTVGLLAPGKWGVTLDFAVEKAQVGLPCPAKMRTMRIEAGSQLGTAQGKIKRIARALIRFYKTLGGKYGPDENNLDPVIYREAGAPMDTPPALLSGDRTFSWPGGYDTEGYVLVVNDSPTPMTVVTIVTEVEVNE